MMLGCRGVAYLYHKEQSIIPNKTDGGWAFIDFGAGKIGQLSYISIIFIILLLIAHYILKYTTHGRNTYAVGGNENSAFNAGINTQRVTFINFVICGFLGGLGGVMLLGVIDNIMNLLNVQTYICTMVTGMIMIGVLYLDKIMMNKRTEKTNLE